MRPRLLCDYTSWYSMEVILCAEAVESVQAGDKCDFIGTLIAVPEVSQLRIEGKNSRHAMPSQL